MGSADASCMLFEADASYALLGASCTFLGADAGVTLRANSPFGISRAMSCQVQFNASLAFVDNDAIVFFGRSKD